MPLTLFRSRVFNVSSAMGATIGMAMFGAIIFIPLYLQLVYGASATQSGLRMLPLMLGLLTAAILSGRAISRIGRYRMFPIAGTGTLVVGMFLLSRLGVGTAPWLASVYMLVVGVGIGLVMQVLVLVVQNDAPPENIGVATATATFFRSMGGSFGVAIFGAIFAARLSRRSSPTSREPSSRALGSGVQLSPAEADELPPAIHAEFLERLRPCAARRVPVGHGDRDRPLRALVVPQGGAAAHDARPLPPSSRAEEAAAGASPPEELVSAGA